MPDDKPKAAPGLTPAKLAYVAFVGVLAWVVLFAAIALAWNAARFVFGG